MRALAKRFNLPVADKKDSQGVCFLGPMSVKEFLEKEIGNDNPALLYTLGQRIPRSDGPWYVVGKDVEKKEIMISKTRASAAREILFTDANWFEEPATVQEAQYRYRGPRVQGHMEKNRFISAVPLSDIPAPGQSIVFYKDDELAGGGIIAA